MSKVITFSRFFPSYHPRAGEPTRFIEKIYAGLADTQPDFKIPNDANAFWDWHEYYNCRAPKFHTIRAGHRWKEGDWFSPRVWSGRPYNSKQIQFAPDIQIKKAWDFEINGADIFLKDWYEYGIGFPWEQVASNDGLTKDDFEDWFILSPDFRKKKVFDGQIISWSDKIEY